MTHNDLPFRPGFGEPYSRIELQNIRVLTQISWHSSRLGAKQQHAFAGCPGSFGQISPPGQQTEAAT